MYLHWWSGVVAVPCLISLWETFSCMLMWMKTTWMVQSLVKFKRATITFTRYISMYFNLCMFPIWIRCLTLPSFTILEVFWEPFVEPWQFEMHMARKQEMSLNSSGVTEIYLQSSEKLSLNITESLMEVFSKMSTLFDLKVNSTITHGIIMPKT